MSSTSQVSSLVCQRYAKALIGQAEKVKKLDKVEKDLMDLRGMIESSADLQAVIRSPLFAQDSLSKAVFMIADKAKLQDVTKNFLGVLIENSRLGALPKVITEFNAMMSKKRGEVSVDIQVAQDLSAGQKKELQVALSKALGKDVAINARVEPSILGGMIVTVGSQMIDDSVARKLERLKLSMGMQANENIIIANSNISEVK